MIIFKRKSFLLILTCLLCQMTFGQNTTVEGYVTEDTSSRVITYAKVYFMGTQVGTTTDTSGYFKLTIPDEKLKEDTLIIAFLGYLTQKIPVTRSISQIINVELKSSLFLEVEEVRVVAGENPAWPFMRRLIANKEKNNPDNLDYYSSVEYSKIRFDLNNFTEKTKKNLLLRPFDYIWDNAKVDEDGVNFLPMLLTEKVSEHYYRNSPTDRKDIITGEKRTGLAGPNLVNFTNDLYLTPNIYDNFITILGKSFPSPLNDNYKNNYRFYLMDSTSTENSKIYKIRFRPKQQRELAFTGEMYFDSASYAITEINLRFDVQANVNFVRSYYITQMYDQVDGEHWMLTESRVVGDFTVLENSSDLTGFFGRKRGLISDYKINTPIEESLFKGIELVESQDSSEYRTDDFWKEHRTEELTKEEVKLFEVTDRVMNDPAYKIRKNLILTFATGYIPLKGIQIGDIYSFYSYNPVERSRIKFGLRTDPNNAFPLHFSTYVAYGTFDEQWKYKLASHVELTKNSITRLGGSYSYDIEQLGRSFNQIAIDNVISSLVQLGNTSSRNYVTRFEGYVEKGLAPGVITRLAYFNTIYSPTQDSLYTMIESDGTLVNPAKYQTAGIRATFKFSYLYSKITGEFYDKKDLYKSFRKFPDLAISYEYSDRETFASDFDYQKLKVSIRQKVRANKLGYFTYNIEAGKTFGTVPHVLLDIPFGNQLILLDDYAFNLMRFMEFATDEYIALHLTHHFDGLIMDRIPLINKLKWRSFIFGKSYIGQLSDANNQSTYLFPTELRGMTEPYYEVGFGFENIFKFAKMDFVWRLTPGEGEYFRFLVKPSFKFSF